MTERDQDQTFEEIVSRLKEGDPLILAGVRDEMARLTVERRAPKTFPDGWYVIRVELMSGRADEFDAPPGRDLIVSPQHTFRQLAEAIDTCFARWDLSHLYAFDMADGSRIGTEHDEYADRLAARTKVARRAIGEIFTYEFDFGDSWLHRCTVTEAGVDAEEVYGARPKGPVAIWGWGSIPDQYGRIKPDGDDEDEDGEDDDA